MCRPGRRCPSQQTSRHGDAVIVSHVSHITGMSPEQTQARLEELRAQHEGSPSPTEEEYAGWAQRTRAQVARHGDPEDRARLDAELDAAVAAGPPDGATHAAREGLLNSASADTGRMVEDEAAHQARLATWRVQDEAALAELRAEGASQTRLLQAELAMAREHQGELDAEGLGRVHPTIAKAEQRRSRRERGAGSLSDRERFCSDRRLSAGQYAASPVSAFNTYLAMDQSGWDEPPSHWGEPIGLSAAMTPEELPAARRAVWRMQCEAESFTRRKEQWKATTDERCEQAGHEAAAAYLAANPITPTVGMTARVQTDPWASRPTYAAVTITAVGDDDLVTVTNERGEHRQISHKALDRDTWRGGTWARHCEQRRQNAMAADAEARTDAAIVAEETRPRPMLPGSAGMGFAQIA